MEEWKKSAKNYLNHPKIKDSLAFAESAYIRWKVNRNRDNYAYSIQDIKDFIRDNPNAEVANFILLKCDWQLPFSSLGILGIIHFRRIWRNNLILDYLAVHPLIAKPGNIIIKGVGSVLLYYITKIAKDLGAEYIWGESTQNSCTYYEKMFGVTITDLILVEKEKYTSFFNTMPEKCKA